jgi:hypothetical protein
MQGATQQYMEQCGTAVVLGNEPPDPWDSISASMELYGAKERWTSGRVKYAWHHGASTLLRDVLIVCKADS